MLVTAFPSIVYAQGKADSAAVDSVAAAAISANTPVVIVNGKPLQVTAGKTQVFQLGSGQSVQVHVATAGDSSASSQAMLQLQQVMGQKGLQFMSGGSSGRVSLGTGGQIQLIFSDGKGGNVIPAPQIKVDAPPQIKLDSTTAAPHDSAAPPSK